MDFIEVIGGDQAEIKTETPDDVVETGLEDTGPFNVGDDGDILDEDKQSNKLETGQIDISQETENVSKLNPSTDKSKAIVIQNDEDESGDTVKGNKEQDNKNDDKPQETYDSKAENLQIKETLVLNYTKNEDLLDDSSGKKFKEIEKEVTGKIYLSRAYKAAEGIPTKKDLPKVEWNKIATSSFAVTEYTIDDVNKYRCNHCQFLTTTEKFVSKHIKNNHRFTIKRRLPECQLANRPLRSLEPVRMSEDWGKKCDLCPKVFKHWDSLGRHKKFIHVMQATRKCECRPECDYQCPSEETNCQRIAKELPFFHSEPLLRLPRIRTKCCCVTSSSEDLPK